MSKGLINTLAELFDEDGLLDSFYSPSFKTESDYLKKKREEIIQADKVNKKLIVNRLVKPVVFL